MKSSWKAALLICFFVAGCKPCPPKYPTAIDEMQCTIAHAAKVDRCLQNQNIPRSVENALLPDLGLGPNDGLDSDKRFDVVANGIPAKAFFLSLFKGSTRNVIVDPKITGTITLDLQQVTLEETLAAVRDMYGYDFKVTPYGYEIFPATLQTRVFNVNYLNVRRVGDSQTQLNSSEITDVLNGSNNPNNNGVGNGLNNGLLGNNNNLLNNNNGQNGNIPPANSGSPVGSTVWTHSEADYWRHLANGIKMIIGIKDPSSNGPAHPYLFGLSLNATDNSGRAVSVDPHAGVVMVKGFPSELREVARFLDVSERNLHRQVIIDAKILEVQLNQQYQAGIDWTAFASSLSQTGTDVKVLPQEFEGMFHMNLSAFHGSFTALIRMLQKQGNVQVLSSPRISTLNNQNAVIKVGEDEFFVTSVTTNITPGSSTNTTSQSVGLTPFFSGITLDVTPQISGKGDIILYIHPSVSRVQDQTKAIDLGASGTLVLPLAKSTIRESDSIVRSKNGEYIVLGGLIGQSTRENLSETPLLSRIPFAGAFFRDTDQQTTKTELVILLRIQLTGYCTTKEYLCEAQRVTQSNRKGMHLGGAPEYFGTEGERFEM